MWVSTYAKRADSAENEKLEDVTHHNYDTDLMDFSKLQTQSWTESTFVAFDLETSGAYALGYDIVEFGAVKWQQGKEIDQLQFLVKPRNPMSDFIITIHGITNEMVTNELSIDKKISQIRDFFKDAILMAHHAPFDMGFIQADFERYDILPPAEPVICTSLLARKVIPESPNHKLQTLIKFLKLDGGQAHRGLDDARACLQLGLHCMNRLGANATLAEVFKNVGKDLFWKNYALRQSGSDKIIKTVQAIYEDTYLDIVYTGGSVTGKRRIKPIGIVRNPDGDYVQAECQIDRIAKRFYFDKMQDIKVVT